MGQKADRQYHGGNLYSELNSKKGRRVFRLQKKWLNPELGKAKKYTEEVPEPYRRTHGKGAATSKLLTGLAAAQAFKKDVDRDAAGCPDHDAWIPTTVKREREARAAQEAKQHRDDRERLLFEVAWPGYLADLEASGDEYANQRDAYNAFKRLALFWNGFYLDQISPADGRRYFTERMNGTGAYKGYGNVTIRPAEVDMNYLGALYRHLRSTDFPDLQRPTLRPLSKKKDSAFAPYRRQHQFAVPENTRLAGLLTAIFNARRKGANGKEQITDAHRALFRLTYETAGRPVSEPCRLRCGNVRFLRDGTATVTYDDTKNEHSERTLPVSKVIADALRSIMPGRFIQRAETPVFSKRRGHGCWTKSSYRRAWMAVRNALRDEYPEIDGMWLRDLRVIAYTALRRAGIDYGVRRRFMGHCPASVSEGYDRVSADDLREAATALENLTLGICGTLAARQGGA